MSRNKGKGKATAKPKPSSSAPSARTAPKAALKTDIKKKNIDKSAAAAAAASGYGMATRAMDDVPTSSIRSTALLDSSSADGADAGSSGSSGDASSGNSSGNTQGTTISANSAGSTGVTTRARKRAATLKSSDTEDAEKPAKRLWLLDPALDEDSAIINTDKTNKTSEDKFDKTTNDMGNKTTNDKINEHNKASKDKGKGKTKAARGDLDAYARFAASASGPFATELEELDADEVHWPRVPEHLRDVVSSEISGEGERVEASTARATASLRSAINPHLDESDTRDSRRTQTKPADATDGQTEDSPYWHRALPAPIPTGPRGAPALWPGSNRGDRDVPPSVPGGQLAPLAPPHPNLRNGFTLSPPRRAYARETFLDGRRVNNFWADTGVYARDYAYADRRPRHLPQGNAHGHVHAQVAANMHAGPAAVGHGQRHGHGQHQGQRQQRFRDDFGNAPAGVVTPLGGPSAAGGADISGVAPFVGGVGSAPPQPHTTGFAGGFGGYADGYSFGLAHAPPAPAERLANVGLGFMGLAGPNRIDRHPDPIQQPHAMVVADVDHPQPQQQPGAEIVEVEDDELDSGSDSGSVTETHADDNKNDNGNGKPPPGAGGAGGAGAAGATGNSGNSGNSGSGSGSGSGKRYDYSSSEGCNGGHTGTSSSGYKHAGAGDKAMDTDAAPPRALSPAQASDISDISDFLLPWMTPAIPEIKETKPLRAGEKYLALMTAHPPPDGASDTLERRYGAWLDSACQMPRPIPHRAPHFLGDAATENGTSSPACAGEGIQSSDVVAAVMQQQPMTLGMEARLLATLGKLPRYDEYPTNTELAAAIVHHDIIARRRSERLRKAQTDSNEAAKLLLGLRPKIDATEPAAAESAEHDVAGTDDAKDATAKSDESEAGDTDASETEAESESEVEVTDAEHWQAKPRYRSPSLSFGSATHAAQLRAALAGHDPAAVLKRLRKYHKYAKARANVYDSEFPNFPGAWRVPTRGELVEARKARRVEERRQIARENRERKRKEKAEQKELEMEQKGAKGGNKRGRKRKVPEPVTLPKLRLTFKRAKIAE